MLVGSWVSTAGASPPFLTCEYVEAGAPGPADNLLRVESDGYAMGVLLYRDGDAIRVFDDAPPFLANFPDAVETTCTGTAPTVTNIDRIEVGHPPGGGAPTVTIDESGRTITGKDGILAPGGVGGPFAPGATPEAHGSEIEISLTSGGRNDVRSLRFIGSSGADQVIAGSRKGARAVALNLDPAADGSQPDADVTAEGVSALTLGGGGGNDRLSGGGQPGMAGEVRNTALALGGGEGDDVLLGRPGRDLETGGPGDDLLRGGRGNDGSPLESGGVGLTGGPGDDRVYGGPGNDELEGDSGHDRIVGGRGHDSFYGSDHQADILNCGPGVERDVQFDRGLDRLRGCERSARE
jgi:hypothetical protein